MLGYTFRSSKVLPFKCLAVLSIPIQLFSATLAEMRLNTTLMEWSINLSVRPSVRPSVVSPAGGKLKKISVFMHPV